jgi:hypothetical protein
MTVKTEIIGYALWHPERGFEVPFKYEGPLAYVRSEDCAEEIRDENRRNGQNTRTGWRAVLVKIVRLLPAQENEG